MKTSKFLVAALAVLGLFSCSKENTPNSEHKSGDPVYAQFAIKLPNAVSGKATLNDPNATPIENEISQVDVYIFNSGTLEQTFTVAAPSNGSTQTTNTAQISSGLKQVVAVVNGGGRITAPVGTTLVNFRAMVSEAASDIINGTNGLFTSPITNVTILNQNSTGGANSQADPFKFTISDVKRAIAKVVVRPINALVSSAFATVGDVKFGINGLMTKSGKLPHFTAEGAIANHGSSVFTRSTSGMNADGATSYSVLAGHTAAFNTILGDGSNGGFYVQENVTPANATFEKATVVYISAVLTPNAKFTNVDNSEGTQIPANTTYYVVKKSDNSSRKFFANEADFTAWKAVHGTGYATTGKLYTDGVNYYPVAIIDDVNNAATKFSVLRGKIYNIKIGNILDFGASSDDDNEIVNPTDPIAPSIFIEATVDVQAWVINDQPTDLQ